MANIKHLLLFSLVLFSLLWSAGCNSTRHSIRKSYRNLSTAEKQLADSILLYALEHEALYTLADELKPMSSVKFYQLPVLSTNGVQRDSARQIMTQVQNVVNKLSKGNFQFVFNPFRQADSLYRNMEIYVFRKNVLVNKIKEHADFYGRLGISPHSLPATVLAVTEYGNGYDRWQSYGYLFGYPSYAVDFFVEAGKTEDSTGKFVSRDFFQIPVYARNTGHFTYAMPKGHIPTSIDSTLYHKATNTLLTYKKERKKMEAKKRYTPLKLWLRLQKKKN